MNESIPGRTSALDKLIEITSSSWRADFRGDSSSSSSIPSSQSSIKIGKHNSINDDVIFCFVIVFDFVDTIAHK